MSKPYFRPIEELPPPRWQPATRSMFRWYVDSTPTPYIDEQDARVIAINRFVRPLIGYHGIELVAANVSLFYGAALVAILTNISPQEFQRDLRRLTLEAGQYITSHPLTGMELVVDPAQTPDQVAEQASAQQLVVLDAIVDWSKRYKKPQLQTWGKALAFAGLAMSGAMRIIAEQTALLIHMGQASAIRDATGVI